MEIQTKSLKIGPYTLKPLPTGLFALDGGAMFGTVPRILWEKSNPPDAKNRIPMEARALLLQSSDKVIVIDTGNGSDFVAKHGEKLGTKFTEMYNVDPSQGLIAALKKQNVTPEQVTDVILTHLHFDHAGGATTEREGKIVPTFPNAKYYVQKKNLETARNPNLRERASYLGPNFEPLLDHKQLTLLEGPIKNLLPHIDLEISNGHTQAQQIVKIYDDKNGLIYGADLIATSSHIRSAWVMGYDLFPLLIIEEKQRILKEVVAKNWFVYFEHDPYCDFASVEFDKNDYKFKERFHLN